MDILRMRRITALSKRDGSPWKSPSETSCGVWCPRLWRSSTAKGLRLPRHLFSTHYQRELDASALRTSSRHSLASMRSHSGVHRWSGSFRLDLPQRHVASSAGGRRWGPDHAFRQTIYGRPSTHLWEDEMGQVHEIAQGEGGEQADPLMPSGTTR